MSSLQNPFLPSSSSYPDLSNSPYIEHNPNTFLLHHHQNPFSTLPIISETCNQQTTNSELVVNGEFLHQYGFTYQRRRPVKKDRHSKIYTAQGLRDRRVRMSIEIARKFFDLQDLLGFDKASKTLEWLLTKSKNAILELSHKPNLIICEQDNSNLKDAKRVKRTKKASAASNAKELREKARARARERTRVKMLSSSTAKFNESGINLDPTFRPFNQSNSIYHNQLDQGPNSSTIAESILIKRKSMMGYQQNFILLNNYPNWNPNLDNNTAIARSTLRAITCINRSTGTHLNGKLWETENSQCLR